MYGACRREELTNLMTRNIEDCGTVLVITLEETKTKKSRTFTVINNDQNFLEYFRKYAALRPNNIKHERFFLAYKNGKCSSQPVGKNTFGSLPAKIAAFLSLPEPSLYTGHCFRRTSATFLADSGADISHLKRHGGWKSACVAEGYVEESIQQKIKTSQKILGPDRQPPSFPQQKPSNSSCSVFDKENLVSITDIPSQIPKTVFERNSTTNVPSVILNNCNNCQISVTIQTQNK